MLRRLGLWCHQRRRVVVALWIVALVAIALSAGSVGSSYSQGVEVGGTESQRAADVLRSRFAAMAGDVGQVVIASDDDVRAPVVEASVGELLRHVGGVQGVRDVTSPYEPSGVGQVSRDGKVGFATIQFDRGVSEIAPSTIERITGLVARFDRSRADESGVRVELGGRMFQESPEVGASEVIGILAAIVILLIAFGSVLAMGLPIAIALFGIGVGAGLVALLSQVVTTPDLTTQLAAMIGIGVGIDYALFIVTRYREALACGDGPAVAVATAIDTAGRAVLFAGGTVMISILGLFIMGVDFVNGMALGVSVTVAAVMVASVTLLPALLGFLGAGIDRFSIRRVRTAASTARGNVWVRWSQFVQRHAVFAALAGLSILLVCAIPVLSMRLAFPDDGANPRSDTTRRAYDLIAEGFGVGFNGPLVLVAKLPNADDAGVVGALAEELAKTPGVAFVGPPVMSPAGDAAVLQIIPTSAPQSVQTEALVHTVRDRIVPDVVAGSGVQVSVGGITAASIDVAEKLSSRLPWFIGGVLVLSFLLLMAVFRSLLVPLKAVIMNLLATGAAYGFVVALFQWGWLSDVVGIDKTGPIAPFIPMMMFAILFGLSMDYEVFLLSRIREEYGATHDNSTAVAHGLAGTARVITAAALIMVTVFASFAFPDNPMVKLFGLGLAFAIAIDATVIRLVLVPSTMELLGDRNWWFPRWLNRVVPEVHVDAAAPPLGAAALGKLTVTGYEDAVDRSAKGVEAVLDEAEWHDKFSIREVIEQYMRWNDDGDFASIVGLFAEDATFQFFGRVLVGREAIAEFFAGVFPAPPVHWTEGGSLFVQPRSIHMSSNPIITVTGDAATAETDFQVVQRSADGHAQVTLVGRYRDRFRRDLATGGWLIECRTGVSVARPGEEGTDAEWRRAIERMDPETRATLQT